MLISRSEFLSRKFYFIEQLKNNKIFVLPTDTIYWISAVCSIENIKKINEIKWSNNRKKLSIIAPSFARIDEHFITKKDRTLEDYFHKYHWVTFILTPKPSSPCCALFAEWYEDNTIWVRILKHPLQNIIEELKHPIISTSANLAWEATVNDIMLLPERIKEKVDFVVDNGSIYWRPSVLIFVDEKKVIER